MISKLNFQHIYTNNNKKTFSLLFKRFYKQQPISFNPGNSVSKPLMDTVSNYKLIQDAYKTIDNLTLFDDCSCFILISPTPNELSFNKIDTTIIPSNNNNNDLFTLFEEIEYGKERDNNINKTFNETRFNTFLGGRISLRRAINDNFNLKNKINIHIPLIRNDDKNGFLILPNNIIGSISHKDNIAVGLASISNLNFALGVDIERINSNNTLKLGDKVLTKQEQKTIGKQLLNISVEEDILLRFSFKEAIYKALYQFIPRKIGFLEVQVYPEFNNYRDQSLNIHTCKIIFDLKENVIYLFI
jgi:4'-phosphopantetheinyl transferase EntD